MKDDKVGVLRAFLTYLSKEIGLSFSLDSKEVFIDKFSQASRAMGYDDIYGWMHNLMRTNLSSENAAVLARHLSVGETYFFRDHYIYDIFQNSIFPYYQRNVLEQGKKLKIWSVGCSSGEEPYSLAILLDKLYSNKYRSQIQIMATDINPDALDKARNGLYTEWSFRNTPTWVMNNYFNKLDNGKYELIQDIKDQVCFKSLNLATESIPSVLNNTHSIDILLCRNVFMYFRQEFISKLVECFHNALVDKGWLIVGGSEGFALSQSSFIPVNFQDTYFFKKDICRKSKEPDIKHTFNVESLNCRIPNKKLRHIPELKPPELIVKPSVSIQEKLDALFKRAVLMYNEGLYDELMKVLDEILEIDNTNIQALLLKINAYSNLNRFDSALIHCDELINKEKYNPEAYYLRGQVLIELEEETEAIISLNKSLYLDPDFVLSHYAFGKLYKRMNKGPESRKHFNNALSILVKLPAEKKLPASDGLTAGRLIEIIEMISFKKN